MADQKPEPPTVEAKKTTGARLTEIQEPGWKSGKSTSMFRAVNPELFVKPNKPVMIAGIVLFSSAVAYIAYMNVTNENKKSYMAMTESGELEKRTKESRWD